MNVCLLMVTYNRLDYTRKSISKLLEDKNESFELYLWDNCSTDGTQDYLKSLDDPRIKEVILHKDNPGPTYAINRIWAKTKAELLGKVDNDCLVTPGWTRILTQAHRDVKDIGAIASWHFRLEDFDEKIAKYKISVRNGHKIFRHSHVCGSGFLIKKISYQRMGNCLDGDRRHGLTGYFQLLAKMGLINGWYVPLILQDHMDDPFSKHCVFHDDASMEAVREITYTMRTHNIRTYSQRLKRRQVVLDNLHYGPWDPSLYAGWNGRLRRHFPAIDKLKYKVKRIFIQPPF
jgi:glycosyltransferase involved in cell wall biosynthesis